MLLRMVTSSLEGNISSLQEKISHTAVCTFICFAKLTSIENREGNLSQLLSVNVTKLCFYKSFKKFIRKCSSVLVTAVYIDTINLC
jgi:hypothetical protein